MRDLIEQELARSRTIIADGVELIPRFRMAAEDGDTLLYAQLPDDIEARFKVLDLVKSYMAVKLVRSFVMATELIEPDASMAIGVSREGNAAAYQVINRSPSISFGEIIWVDPDEIGDEIPSMLPDRVASVSDESIKLVSHLVQYNEALRLEAL